MKTQFYVFTILLLFSLFSTFAKAQVSSVEGFDYLRAVERIEKVTAESDSEMNQIEIEKDSLRSCRSNYAIDMKELQKCFDHSIRLKEFLRDERSKVDEISDALGRLWGAKESKTIDHKIEELKSLHDFLDKELIVATKLVENVHFTLINIFTNKIMNTYNANYSRDTGKLLCDSFQTRSFQIATNMKLQFDLGFAKDDLFKMSTAVRTTEALSLEASQLARVCSSQNGFHFEALNSLNQNLENQFANLDQKTLVTKACAALPKEDLAVVSTACENRVINPSFTYWLSLQRSKR